MATQAAQLQVFNDAHFPPFTSKALAIQTIRQYGAEEGVDLEHVLKRLALSDASAWADEDALTQAEYLAILDTGDPQAF